MDQNNNTEQNTRFSLIFKGLDEAKQKIDFQSIAETMDQSNAISLEIEKLRDIVTEDEQHSFTILTTV